MVFRLFEKEPSMVIEIQILLNHAVMNYEYLLSLMAIVTNSNSSQSLYFLHHYDASLLGGF